MAIVDAEEKASSKLNVGKWTYPLSVIMTKKDWILEPGTGRAGGGGGGVGKKLSIRICLRLLKVDDKVYGDGVEEEEELLPSQTSNDGGPENSAGSKSVKSASTAQKAGSGDAESVLSTSGPEGNVASADERNEWANFPRVSVEEIYGGRVEGKGDEADEGFGLIRLTIEPRKGNVLRVVVHQCKDLIAADDEG